MADDAYADAREDMVRIQLAARDVTDPRVLDAMRRVPRHEFVPDALRDYAYEDRPLPIGHGQTISQPYIVALTCQLARVTPASRVLEVGAGCGYQAAVLAELAAEVHGVEIVGPLAHQATRTLARLGYANAHIHHADGNHGWPPAAPYDAVVVAAAAPKVPQALLDQLKDDGRLVVPVGTVDQHLRVYHKTPDGIVPTTICGVAFVPLTGDTE